MLDRGVKALRVCSVMTGPSLSPRGAKAPLTPEIEKLRPAVRAEFRPLRNQDDTGLALDDLLNLENLEHGTFDFRIR